MANEGEENQGETSRGGTTPGETAGDESAPSRRLRWTYFVVALVVLAPIAGYVWYALRGLEGLAAFGLGLVFGGFLCGIALFVGRRQATAKQGDVFREIVFGSFVSVFAFLIGSLLLMRIWNAALVPTTLTALVLYLGFKFFYALRASNPRAR